jgi:hypothetical protein
MGHHRRYRRLPRGRGTLTARDLSETRDELTIRLG